MKKEKEATAPASRVDIKFRDFKIHSDNFQDYFVDSEKSNYVKPGSDGTHNKADIAFEELVNDDAMPNRKNGNVKKQADRRYK